MDLLAEMTLLYAEDEELTQGLYQQYFSHYFKAIYLAKDGQQALELYETKKPDVVILDINMPKVNGLSVCKKIRQYDKNTKIILLTARSDKEALVEAIELGLTCYLEKPITRSQLKDALKKLIDSEYQENTIELWIDNSQKYTWHPLKHVLSCNGESIHLTKKEILLLSLLVKSNGRTVTYEKIYQSLWLDEDMGFSVAAIKTLLKGLRTKLPPDAIKNSYGVGYFLEQSKKE